MATARPDGERPGRVIAELGAPRGRDLALIVAGGVAAGLFLAAVVAVAEPFPAFSLSPGQDARSYWAATYADPYAISVVGTQDFYPYSPAFLQVIAPLRALPWAAFSAAWTSILLLALLALTGPRLFLGGLVLALPELWGGNIHLLLALAVAAGLRQPAAWAFPLLTKVTPGIGLLWFALRREWRALGVAAAFTALVAGASFLVSPAAWTDWARVLVENSGVAGGQMSRGAALGSIGLPFFVRLPVAVWLVWWGARTGRPWVLPAAAMLAQPLLWFGGLTLLLGAVPYLRGAAWARPARPAIDTAPVVAPPAVAPRSDEAGSAQR